MLPLEDQVRLIITTHWQRRQRQLAQRAGISAAMLSHWLRYKKHSMSVCNLVAICQVIDYNITLTPREPNSV